MELLACRPIRLAGTSGSCPDSRGADFGDCTRSQRGDIPGDPAKACLGATSEQDKIGDPQRPRPVAPCYVDHSISLARAKLGLEGRHRPRVAVQNNLRTAFSKSRSSRSSGRPSMNVIELFLDSKVTVDSRRGGPLAGDAIDRCVGASEAKEQDRGQNLLHRGSPVLGWGTSCRTPNALTSVTFQDHVLSEGASRASLLALPGDPGRSATFPRGTQPR